MSFLWNLLKGKASPNCVILFFLGERFQRSVQVFLSFALKSCLNAEALLGRGFLKRWGKSMIALEWPSAASLAKQSASSLPGTSLWLDIQLMDKLLAVLSVAALRYWIKYCPGEAL